jgi:hypothetical protein
VTREIFLACHIILREPDFANLIFSNGGSNNTDNLKRLIMGAVAKKLTKIRIKIYILCAGLKLGQYARVVILGVLRPGCFSVSLAGEPSCSMLEG